MERILKKFRKNRRRPVTPNNEAITEYVKINMVSVQEGTKCVDGRYLPNQAQGMLARPGADAGYVMALEAVNRKKNLGLTPEQCFNTVFKAVKQLNGKFYFHTDHHVDPNTQTHEGLIGCGHLAKAARSGFSWEYDVSSKDVRKMVNYARNLSEVSSSIEMINLSGEHQEKGFLIIHSKHYTVLADNPKLHQMYFIYDQDRDHAFLQTLVAAMNIPGLTIKDMQEEADLQLTATLHNLAVGLPVYDVTFVGKTPHIIYREVVRHNLWFPFMHMPLHTPFALRQRFLHRVN